MSIVTLSLSKHTSEMCTKASQIGAKMEQQSGDKPNPSSQSWWPCSRATSLGCWVCWWCWSTARGWAGCRRPFPRQASPIFHQLPKLHCCKHWKNEKLIVNCNGPCKGGNWFTVHRVPWFWSYFQGEQLANLHGVVYLISLKWAAWY